MADGIAQDSILQRIADGEQSAVSECLDQYGGLVWSLARRWRQGAGDAEDAVQDIFVSIWKNASRFDPSVASETTFVAMIARRRLIDRARRDGRRPKESSLDVAISGPADTSAPADRTAMGEDASKAEAALRELSEDQQRVIRMAVIHGLSHEKIAASTGMPLGTVKTHIRRGLIRVRQILARQSASGGAIGGTDAIEGTREAGVVS